MKRANIAGPERSGDLVGDDQARGDPAAESQPNHPRHPQSHPPWHRHCFLFFFYSGFSSLSLLVFQSKPNKLLWDLKRTHEESDPTFLLGKRSRKEIQKVKWKKIEANQFYNEVLRLDALFSIGDRTKSKNCNKTAIDRIK
ncbi:hypothetical protein L484_005221 [Morus notabilis]|uniref:Uncharacterized protein n=1 Tax=Morus notabilis TaxID=981085 RepID=W9QWY9_9ROSA|nr:hypothetical protein L484_005221 [Morus notabilis]